MNTGGLSVKTFVALIATVMLLVTASQSQLFASAPIEDRAPADILSSNNVARLLAETPLEASGNAGDQFGNAVAITAEFAVVGAHRVDQGLSNEAGAVYVFHRDEGGAENWGTRKSA